MSQVRPTTQPEGQRSSLRDFAKGSFILILCNLSLKAVNFFLLPVYTRHLSMAMLGVSDIVTMYLGLFQPLLLLGLDTAYGSFYFDQDNTTKPGSVYFSYRYALRRLALIPLLLLPCSAFLARLALGEVSYRYIVAAALLTIAFQLWNSCYALELRLQNRLKSLGFIHIATSLLMLGFNLIFVVWLQFGALALSLSSALAFGCQSLIYLTCIRFNYEEQPVNKLLLRRMLAFSLPLLPHVAAVWLLTLSGRFILQAQLGAAAVGLYGIGSRFVMMLQVFISAINTAYTSFAFGNKEKAESKEQYAKVVQFLALFFSLIAFGVALFAREIVVLMAAPAYRQAYQAVRDLLFGQMFFALANLIAHGIFFQKKSHHASLATTLAALLSIALSYALIPALGFAAVALAGLLGYLLYFALIYFFAWRQYPCSYGLGRILPCAALLYALAYGCELWRWPAKLLVFALGLTLLYLFYLPLIRQLKRLGRNLWQGCHRANLYD